MRVLLFLNVCEFVCMRECMCGRAGVCSIGDNSPRDDLRIQF